MRDVRPLRGQARTQAADGEPCVHGHGDADYEDGYTSPEVHDEAVRLMVKLNPQPLTRCLVCAMFGLSADGDSWCKRTLWRTSPDGFCSEAQRKGVDRD